MVDSIDLANELPITVNIDFLKVLRAFLVVLWPKSHQHKKKK